MHIDEETRTAIHRLWDEMAELPASAPEVCLNKLFTEISALIDSRHGPWLSSLRLADDADNDPLLGWRARSVFFHGELPADQQAYTGAVKRLDKGIPDESTYNHVRRAGEFRATLLVDHVSEGFYSGDHYIHHYLGRGITDRLFVVMPVNEDVESYFMFDRPRGQPDFTPAGPGNRQLRPAQPGLAEPADPPQLRPADGRRPAHPHRARRAQAYAGRQRREKHRRGHGPEPAHHPPVRENPVPQIQCAQPRGADRPVAGTQLTAHRRPQTMCSQ
ncbi:hypothetical protein [Alloalcanivorax venustensis]|nr:hypothetical protein [Alloalcanivorax venustensis]